MTIPALGRDSVVISVGRGRSHDVGRLDDDRPAPLVTATTSAEPQLPFDDMADVEDAMRGRIAPGHPLVKDARGEVVWDNDSYVFLDGEPAATVHPRAGLTRRG
jgi:alkyl sulfatase BDS1-like metallo-beta-lactamase superfamily hydrolase